MRSNLSDNIAKNLLVQELALQSGKQVISGDVSLSIGGNVVSYIDGGAGARNVTFSTFKKDAVLFIMNVGTSNDLVVKDPVTVPLAIIEAGAGAFFFCDGDEWFAFAGGGGGGGGGLGDALTSDGLDQFAPTTSAELKGVITDETGSGALVFATSPTLVTPNLGTPNQLNLENATNLPISSTTGDLDVGRLDGGAGASVSTFWRGDGQWAAPQVVGDALTTDGLDQFAATTSAELAGVITDETGTGALVFATGPTIGLVNATGLPISTGVAGLGSGVAADLAVPVTSSVLTIASGAITVTGKNHTVHTEADASSDELITINGGTDGMVVTLRANAGNRHVLVRGTGNIALINNIDCFLSDDNLTDTIMLKYQASSSKWAEIARNTNPFREVLPAGGRTLYLRYDLGACTLSLTTPCEATLAGAHNLVAGDQVVFSLPYEATQENTLPSFTGSTPGVIDFGAVHGYVSNTPIRLRKTGTLPSPLAEDTVYFVRNPTATTFEVSLTSGGASLNFTGSLVGYFKVERWSLLPTGVTEGQVYFVLAAGLTSTVFRFALTDGGTAINASGTQRGKVTVQTGNDASSGVENTPGAALMTLQHAFDRSQTYDFRGLTVAVIPAYSTYTAADGTATLVILRSVIGDDDGPASTAIGGGKFAVIGPDKFRDRVVLRSTNAPGITIYGVGAEALWFRSLTIDTTSEFNPGVIAVTAGANPILVDHIAFRGEMSACIESYGSKVNMHGMTEVIGTVSYNGFVKASGEGGEINYYSQGGDYFGGVIAYGPAKTPDQVLYAYDFGKVYMGLTVQWEGTWSAPWARVAQGGTITTGFYPAPDGNEETYGEAPVVSGGGSIFVRDWTPSGTSSVDYYMRNDDERVRLAANFEKTNDTLADVTGFSFRVMDRVAYDFELTLLTTSNVAAGVKFELSGTAVMTSLIAEAIVMEGTSIVVKERVTALDTPFGDITAVAAATVTIKGTFVPSTRGTFTLQFAQNATNAAASTILAGSAMFCRATT